jgi:hypothetical protein
MASPEVAVPPVLKTMSSEELELLNIPTRLLAVSEKNPSPCPPAADVLATINAPSVESLTINGAEGETEVSSPILTKPLLSMRIRSLLLPDEFVWKVMAVLASSVLILKDPSAMISAGLVVVVFLKNKDRVVLAVPSSLIPIPSA